jgi:hypothetical protein
MGFVEQPGIVAIKAVTSSRNIPCDRVMPKNVT